MNQQRVELSKGYAADLEKEHQRVDALIQKISELRWNREDSGFYQLNLRFDPRAMMFGYGRYEEQKFLAQMISRQVEAEIATSKFIQKAEDTRRRATWPPDTNPWGTRQ